MSTGKLTKLWNERIIMAGGEISTLFECAMQAVLRDISVHERALGYLPAGVKTSLAHVMAKRGLLTDSNCKLVLHDGITELDLAECELSVSTFQVLCRLCPRLHRLHLNNSRGCRITLNSKVFCDIFSHCTRLRIVNLKCCTLLDNAAVACLAQNCPYIQSLCLSGCHMICDKAVSVISLRSRHMQALDLTKTKVTNSGLKALSGGVCSKVIKELNVSHCLNVTDEGILHITNNCPRLSIFVFHGCPMVTSLAREATSNLSLKQVTWTIY